MFFCCCELPNIRIEMQMDMATCCKGQMLAHMHAERLLLRRQFMFYLAGWRYHRATDEKSLFNDSNTHKQHAHSHTCIYMKDSGVLLWVKCRLKWWKGAQVFLLNVRFVLQVSWVEETDREQQGKTNERKQCYLIFFICQQPFLPLPFQMRGTSC